MSNFKWSDIPRSALIGGGVALLVVAGLTLKMGLDLKNLPAGDAATSASSAAAGSSDATLANKPVATLTGFRSASFGDDEAAVRAAITKDFSVPDDKIASGESPVEKTKFLVVHVKDVVPGSGIAEIVYILGYKSQKLIQVNLFWGSNFSPELTPQQFGAVASQLGQYFNELGLDPKTISANQKLPNNTLRVFSGRDAKGHLITLLFQEAEAKLDKPDVKASDKTDKAKADAAPETRKIAGLRLAYVAAPEAPDIFKIEKGKF
ncbi:MAG: hypothetical protein ACOH12_10360 [Parvibaculaceae bacterium]